MRKTPRIVTSLILVVTAALAAAQTPIHDHPKWTTRLETAISRVGASETVAAWIFLADKGADIGKKLAATEANLTPHARERRLRHRGPENLVDTYDVPVDTGYIREISRRTGRIRHVSRWLNAVSVEARPADLTAIAELHFVKKLDLVRRDNIPRPQPEATALPPRDPPGPVRSPASFYGPSFTQVDQINVPALHNLGYNGHGVMICMLDAGFNNLAHDALDHLDILITRDFVNNDSIVWDEPNQMGTGNHGTYTLSVIGGFAPGQLVGPAWGATYILAKTENTDWERHIEEDHWVAGAEWADSIGADIISSSLGYLNGFTHGETNYTWQDMDGNTTISTIGADIAAGRGILVVNSAGNSGQATPPANSLIGPTDGDSVLSVGAVDGSGARAFFSSTGPTFDGRTKPDVMAMGQAVIAASSTDPGAYVSVNGTSFSCPLTAGAAALLLEAHPQMTNMNIIQAFRNTATQSGAPDNLMGWGIIDAAAAAATVTAIGDRLPTARGAILYPAAPNPFNPMTTLRYELHEPARVVLTVYNVRGQHIATLVNEDQTPGVKSIAWSGTNGDGRPVSSGIYLYRLEAGRFTQTKKMVLLK